MKGSFLEELFRVFENQSYLHCTVASAFFGGEPFKGLVISVVQRRSKSVFNSVRLASISASN